MKNVKSYCPLNKADWRGWLRSNHIVENAIWVIFYKKKSLNYNLSWSDAVDEALCFGWIDSTKKKICDEKYQQYFTKRKPKSNWSKINKEKVKLLVDKGLMEERGRQSIEIAKQNGSWDFLNEIEALIVPEDLRLELEKYEGAIEYFDALSNSVKRSFLYWIASARRAETRLKRIGEIAKNAGEKLKPKRFRL